VITTLVVIQGGFSSPVFIFYFAAALGFSVAFPTQLTAVYTAIAIVTYGLICLATSLPSDEPAIFTRALMIAAIAICGTLFARSERERRAHASELHVRMLAEIRSDRNQQAEPVSAPSS
jgi:hypothetical protein